MRNTDYTRSSKTANKQPKNYQLKTVKNITEDQKNSAGLGSKPHSRQETNPTKQGQNVI